MTNNNNHIPALERLSKTLNEITFHTWNIELSQQVSWEIWAIRHIIDNLIHEKNSSLERNNFLEVRNKIIKSKSYKELFENIEGSCETLKIEQIYFDFPKEAVWTHFHNPEIYQFLQEAFQFSKKSKHILFNCPLQNRENIKGSHDFHCQEIHITLLEQTFRNMDIIMKTYTDITIGDNIELTLWENWEVLFTKKAIIWVISSQHPKWDLQKIHLEVQELLEDIRTTIERLWKEEKLQKHANTDSLTWLYNRGFIDKAIQDFKYMHTPLAFMTFDANGFKAINDTHWHDAWDLMIQEFAKTLKQVASDYDMKSQYNSQSIVARPGWDEFQILFPYCDRQTAENLCEEFMYRVHQIAIPYKESILKIGTCIWVKIWDWADVDVNFAKEADQALYNRKDVKNDAYQLHYLIIDSHEQAPEKKEKK